MESVAPSERTLSARAVAGLILGLAVSGTFLWLAVRNADLFVCEATLLRGELDGEPRGHLSLDECVEAYEASGAKRLLVTHRPCELPDPEDHELAFDGLEIDV